MIERELPAGRRIADALREAIEQGHFPPGARLPAERALAAEHGTARHHARDAIDILQREGLVTLRHGRAAHVRRPVQLVRLGAQRFDPRLRSETGLSPFQVEAQRLGRKPRVDVLDVARIVPPPEVAERLHVAADEACVVQRVNLYTLDDEPVQLGVTYLPWALAANTPLASKRATGPGGLYSRLAELGHRVGYAREEVTARMPRTAEMRALSIPAGVPVLELLHTSLDGDGLPFEVSRFVLRADVSAVDYLLPVER